MKPILKKNAPLLLTLFAIVLTIGLVSWGQKQTGEHYRQAQNDTTPKKTTRPTDGKSSDRDKKVRDLDDVLNELEEADMKVDPIAIGLEKIQKEISESLKQFDGEKIKLEIEKAMKEVDIAKIQKEVQESLAKIDMEKIQAEIKEAMKEVDMEKIQKEIKESLAKVDMEKIQVEIKEAMKEVEKLKEIDMKKLDLEMKKVQEEMKELGPKLEKELAKAKVEIEKAKTGLKEFKGFVDGLENDGLINKKEGYALKHKDGELFINGKKASEQVYNKYRNFLEKHRKFNIEKTDYDFDMDLD